MSTESDPQLQNTHVDKPSDVEKTAVETEGEQVNTKGEQGEAEAGQILAQESAVGENKGQTTAAGSSLQAQGRETTPETRQRDAEGGQITAELHPTERDVDQITSPVAEEGKQSALNKKPSELEGQGSTGEDSPNATEKSLVEVEGQQTLSEPKAESEGGPLDSENEQINTDGEEAPIKLERGENEAETEEADLEEDQENAEEEAKEEVREIRLAVSSSLTERDVKVTNVKPLEKSISVEKYDSKTSTISVEPVDDRASYESGNPPEHPMAPRSSHLSYDGQKHPQHREVKSAEIHEALHQLSEEEQQVSAEGSKMATPADQTTKHEQTFSYRARAYDEKMIMAAMRQTPARREFTGYIFSSQTQRPFGVSNYFLPVVPQPMPRTHIRIQGKPVPPEVLHRSSRAAPAPRGVLPLSSIRITWCLGPRNTIYTMPVLYAYLSRFGPIECIYQMTPNSALVIFCDLVSARACVKCPELGMPWDSLMATWWERRLHNNGYLATQLRQEELSELAATATAPKLEEKKAKELYKRKVLAA